MKTFKVNSPRILDHTADLRSLLWSLGLFPLPALVAFFAPQFWVGLLMPTFYLSFCAGVLAHYHNHRPVFRRPGLNRLYACWLSIFYGFPLLGWIPTHNQNHHKYVNGEGDATRTERAGQDGLLTALLYPLRSSAWQAPALHRYLGKQRKRGGYAALEVWLQTLSILSFHVLVGALCIGRHGLVLGGGAYLVLVFVPALLSTWAMMFTNYLQHVGCDPTSIDNHSRNFVGAWENWFVFDAGLHTVHHEHPGTHWSQYRSLHAARVSKIDPALCERNMFSFLWRRYVSG